MSKKTKKKEEKKQKHKNVPQQSYLTEAQRTSLVTYSKICNFPVQSITIICENAKADMIVIEIQLISLLHYYVDIITVFKCIIELN